MVQGSYTAEAWSKMIHKPEDREKIYRKLIEKAGGKLGPASCHRGRRA